MSERGLLIIGRRISGVSFQLAIRAVRKLEAYATVNATVILWPMLIRFVSLAMLLAAAHGLVSRACAAEPEKTDATEKPLNYRRVFVPEARIKELISGYRPMKRDEFQRLVERLSGPATGVVPEAVIVSAQYKARFERDQLVDGEAVLDVLHNSEERAAVPLNGMHLAVGRAVWQEEPPREATIALGADGNQALLVEKSSQLRMPWSLRGERDASGAVRFRLQLPPCSSSRLILEIPSDLMPVVDNGFVTPWKDKDAAASSPDNTLSGWLIELSGQGSATLQIVSQQIHHQQQQLVYARKVMAYNLAPNGLKLSAELHLDVYHQPLTHLRLKIDPELTVTSVRSGDRELEVATVIGEGENAGELVLELPSPILGVDRVVYLGAIAPLPVGKLWRVPDIQPQEVFWQAGTATIAIFQPLTMNQLVTTACRQSSTGRLPAPDRGEVIQLQQFTSAAAVDVELATQTARVSCAAGTTNQLDAAAMTAVTRAEFSASEGECFQLDTDVSRLWVLDTIDVNTAAREPAAEKPSLSWEVVAEDAAAKHLRIQLSEPIRADHPVRLTFRLHRPLPEPGIALDLSQLRPVRFPQIERTRHLVALSAAPPYRFSLTGDAGVVRLDSQTLSALEKELLAVDPSALLFVADADATRLRAIPDFQRARYAADIRVQALVDPTDLVESYEIRVSPESSRVERLLIHLSKSRMAPIQWMLDGSEPRDLEPRRLTVEQAQREGLGADGGETWEITLRRPRDVPFTIHARRSTALSVKQPVSLAWAPQATNQTGMLVVGAEGGVSLSIDDPGLTSLPAEPVGAAQNSTTRAVFRYDPAEATEVVVGRAAEANRQPSAWIWLSQVTSRFDQDGASHCATMYVETTGTRSLEVKLPASATLRQVLVDGREVLLVRPSAANAIVAPLPPGVRFPAVQIFYSTSDSCRSLMENLSAPWPQADVPVLDQRWTVWLPPGYAPAPETNGFRDDVPWDRRLLGALRRPAEDRWLQFVSWDYWHALVRGEGGAALTLEDAQPFLAVLPEFVQQGSGAVNQPTWGTLLTSYAHQLPHEGAVSPALLLVDAGALREAGITPRTRLEVIPPAELSGRAILSSANLAIVVRPDAIVLTSATKIAMHGDRLEFADNGVVASIRGDAARSLSRDALAASPIVSVDTWTEMPDLPATPWKVVPPTDYASLGDIGWTAHEITLGSSPSAVLRVYCPAAMQAIGWAMLLLTAALSWQISARWPARLVALAAVFGFVTLVVPVSYLSVASGAFLGVLLAGGLRLVGKRSEKWPQRLTGSDRAAESVRRVSVATLLIIALGTLTVTNLLRAQSADLTGNATAAGGRNYPVLIPVDEASKPVGDYLYLPQEFKDAILARSATLSATSNDWLIRSASYNCTLTDSAGRLTVNQLTASFDLEVARPNTRIVLPFARDDLFLLPDNTKLDGKAALADWTTDGAGLVVDAAQAGRQKLELALRPVIRTTGSFTGLDCSVPRVPRAQLRVVAPKNSNRIELPSAIGCIRTGTSDGQWDVDLGPADRLTVRWPTPGSPGASPALIDVDQLLWLKVNPSSVVVDAKFTFSAPRGRELREVKLAVDPRWLIRLTADQPVRQRQRRANADTQLVELDVPQPADKVSFFATFSLAADSGIGYFPLPRIEAVADRFPRRWLAISVGDDLQFERSADENLRMMTTADFLGQWGKTNSTEPLFAIQWPDVAPPWIVATQPLPPEIVATEKSVAIVRRDDIEIRFDAAPVNRGGACFQLTIQAPPELRVENVELAAGSSKSNIRWATAADGTLHVFLTSALTGTPRLSVRGRLPLSGRENISLSRLALTSVQPSSQRYFIYRKPDVAVRCDRAGGPPELDDSAVENQVAKPVRLVSAWQSDPARPDDDAKDPNLQITPNEPRATCRLATVVARDGAAWTAEADYQLTVGKDVVDVIRWDLPAQWQGPFVIEPAMRHEVVEVPGQTRRRLVIYPPQAVDTLLQFKVRGPLTGQPVSVPDIVPLDVDRAVRFVTLPQSLQGQQIQWETSGLRAVDPMADIDGGRDLPLATTESYRVVSPEFRASIQHVGRTTGVPQVRLVDIDVTVFDDGGYYGAATFDLEAAARRDCVLKLPLASELVQASVAGLPAALSNVGANHWKIDLGASQFPQRVTVLFRGRAAQDPAGAGRDRVLEAPQLVGIPVERTLWTVSGPGRSVVTQAADPIRRVEPLRQEVFRYRAAANLIDLAADSVTESSPDAAANWYFRWARRLTAARSRITYHELVAPLSDDHDPSEIASIQASQSSIADRLAARGVLNQLAAAPLECAEASDVWNVVQTPLAAEAHLMSPAATPEIKIRLANGTAAVWLARLLAALVWIAGMTGLYLLLTRGPIGDWLVQWPLAVGVLAGAAWWLWLTPSVVGVAIVLASLIGSLRAGFSSSRLADPSS